jgi:riboflavin kinase/FMN adenylyltransferase
VAHTITGTVVHGSRRGRELGFPTANLRLGQEAQRPALGIYAADVRVVGDRDMAGLPGAVSVGVRPTFEDDGEVLVEVHLIGVSADLYGRTLEVELLELLREEQAFASAEALIEQMGRDVEAAAAAHSAAYGPA